MSKLFLYKPATRPRKIVRQEVPVCIVVSREALWDRYFDSRLGSREASQLLAAIRKSEPELMDDGDEFDAA